MVPNVALSLDDVTLKQVEPTYFFKNTHVIAT